MDENRLLKGALDIRDAVVAAGLTELAVLSADAPPHVGPAFLMAPIDYTLIRLSGGASRELSVAAVLVLNLVNAAPFWFRIGRWCFWRPGWMPAPGWWVMLAAMAALAGTLKWLALDYFFKIRLDRRGLGVLMLSTLVYELLGRPLYLLTGPRY
jgi:hypothetical protein